MHKYMVPGLPMAKEFPCDARMISEGLHIIYSGEMCENTLTEWRIWLGHNGGWPG